jgi:hypothetical protein
MINIQMLTGIFLLFLLVGTKSTITGKDKSTYPEPEGHGADDELWGELWPTFHQS